MGYTSVVLLPEPVEPTMAISGVPYTERFPEELRSFLTNRQDTKDELC